MVRQQKGIAAIVILIIVLISTAVVAGGVAGVYLINKNLKEKKVTDKISTSSAEVVQSKETWKNDYIYWAEWKEFMASLSYPIQRMKGDGSGQSQVFSEDFALNSIEGVSVSPDGKKFAYACPSGVNDLCVKNTDGSGLLVLDKVYPNIPTQVSWSRDGKSLIFSVLTPDNGLNEQRIATISPDNTGYKELTPHGAVPGGAYDPSYSPDDSKVIFEVKKKSGDSDIYIMNADGSDAKPLISTGSIEQEPAFSPDGKTIAYSVTESFVSQVWIANVDGSNPKKLTTSGSNKSPAFSPDGKKIAFVSNRDDDKTFEVYITNIDGSAQTRLTNNNVDDLSPSWSKYKIGK